MVTTKLIKQLLVITFCISALAPITQAQEQAIANKEIIEMVKAGLTAEIIIAKIKSSPCQFDTSPSALVSLKEAGVADAVLLEMLRNPHGAEPVVEKRPAREQAPAEPVAKQTPQPVS